MSKAKLPVVISFSWTPLIGEQNASQYIEITCLDPDQKRRIIQGLDPLGDFEIPNRDDNDNKIKIYVQKHHESDQTSAKENGIGKPLKQWVEGADNTGVNPKQKYPQGRNFAEAMRDIGAVVADDGGFVYDKAAANQIAEIKANRRNREIIAPSPSAHQTIKAVYGALIGADGKLTEKGKSLRYSEITAAKLKEASSTYEGIRIVTGEDQKAVNYAKILMEKAMVWEGFDEFEAGVKQRLTEQEQKAGSAAGTPNPPLTPPPHTPSTFSLPLSPVPFPAFSPEKKEEHVSEFMSLVSAKQYTLLYTEIGKILYNRSQKALKELPKYEALIAGDRPFVILPSNDLFAPNIDHNAYKKVLIRGNYSVKNPEVKAVLEPVLKPVLKQNYYFVNNGGNNSGGHWDVNKGEKAIDTGGNQLSCQSYTVTAIFHSLLHDPDRPNIRAEFNKKRTEILKYPKFATDLTAAQLKALNDFLDNGNSSNTTLDGKTVRMFQEAVFLFKGVSGFTDETTLNVDQRRQLTQEIRVPGVEIVMDCLEPTLKNLGLEVIDAAAIKYCIANKSPFTAEHYALHAGRQVWEESVDVNDQDFQKLVYEAIDNLALGRTNQAGTKGFYDDPPNMNHPNIQPIEHDVAMVEQLRNEARQLKQDIIQWRFIPSISFDLGAGGSIPMITVIPAAGKKLDQVNINGFTSVRLTDSSLGYYPNQPWASYSFGLNKIKEIFGNNIQIPPAKVEQINAKLGTLPEGFKTCFNYAKAHNLYDPTKEEKKPAAPQPPPPVSPQAPPHIPVFAPSPSAFPPLTLFSGGHLPPPPFGLYPPGSFPPPPASTSSSLPPPPLGSFLPPPPAGKETDTADAINAAFTKKPVGSRVDELKKQFEHKDKPLKPEAIIKLPKEIVVKTAAGEPPSKAKEATPAELIFYNCAKTAEEKSAPTEAPQIKKEITETVKLAKQACITSYLSTATAITPATKISETITFETTPSLPGAMPEAVTVPTITAVQAAFEKDIDADKENLVSTKHRGTGMDTTVEWDNAKDPTSNEIIGYQGFVRINGLFDDLTDNRMTNTSGVVKDDNLFKGKYLHSIEIKFADGSSKFTPISEFLLLTEGDSDHETKLKFVLSKLRGLGKVSFVLADDKNGTNLQQYTCERRLSNVYVTSNARNADKSPVVKDGKRGEKLDPAKHGTEFLGKDFNEFAVPAVYKAVPSTGPGNPSATAGGGLGGGLGGVIL